MGRAHGGSLSESEQRHQNSKKLVQPGLERGPSRSPGPSYLLPGVPFVCAPQSPAGKNWELAGRGWGASHCMSSGELAVTAASFPSAEPSCEAPRGEGAGALGGRSGRPLELGWGARLQRWVGCREPWSQELWRTASFRELHASGLSCANGAREVRWIFTRSALWGLGGRSGT